MWARSDWERYHKGRDRAKSSHYCILCRCADPARAAITPTSGQRTDRGRLGHIAGRMPGAPSDPPPQRSKTIYGSRRRGLPRCGRDRMAAGSVPLHVALTGQLRARDGSLCRDQRTHRQCQWPYVSRQPALIAQIARDLARDVVGNGGKGNRGYRLIASIGNSRAHGRRECLSRHC
jgi:hypothetical protein